MAIQFQRDYELLELEKECDWTLARTSYRRLVNVWHPDRFANRPRERAHAQQQFIELTKSFNNLREFYKQNNRMPFERMTHAVSEPAEPPIQKSVSPVDDDLVENGILNKRKLSGNKKSLWSKVRSWWVIPAAFAIAGSVMVFSYIDRSAHQQTVEEAKRVLRNTQPSSFMPDRDAIKKQNNTQRLVNSTNSGTIGDKLARDVFK